MEPQMVRLKQMIRAALSVALMLVFLSIFRGITNILNAFLVPMTVYFTSSRMNTREITAFFLLTLIMTGLFHNIQIPFMMLYLLMAFLLKEMNQRRFSMILKIGGLTTVAGLGFYVSIRMTDYFFLTRMNYIFIKMFDGRSSLYALMLLLEGFLISLALIVGSARMDQRIKSI